MTTDNISECDAVIHEPLLNYTSQQDIYNTAPPFCSIHTTDISRKMSKRDEDMQGVNDEEGNNGNEVEEQLIPSSTNGTNTKKRTKTVVKAGKVVKKKLVKKKVSKNKENATDKLIKYSALFLLVGQMVGLVLLMRYTRTNRAPDQPLYLASSAVFMMECMKFFICCCVIAYQSGGGLVGELYEHVINSPMEMVKLCVPSLLYTIQNNLLYLALTNLDAATYQVCYQLKILTTALFSALLLQVRDAMCVCVSIKYMYL
jgi:hypothetical protein